MCSIVGPYSNSHVKFRSSLPGSVAFAVKVSSEEELLELRRLAVGHSLPHSLIRDAGMTELPPGTITVLGIGPAKTEIIDEVTGELKLL